MFDTPRVRAGDLFPNDNEPNCTKWNERQRPRQSRTLDSEPGNQNDVCEHVEYERPNVQHHVEPGTSGLIQKYGGRRTESLC